jgi:hypothetical protein
VSNNQHTPGPWYVLGGYVSSKSGGEIVCPIKRIRDADLPLIAAAPDLLKTCRVLLERTQQLSAGTEAIDGLIPDARMDLELDIEDASKLIDRIEGGAE